MTRAGTYRATAFGARWRSDIALDEFDADPDPLSSDDDAIAVQRIARLAERPALHRFKRGHLCADGFRLIWDDQTVFDMVDGKRIDYLPGAGWSGVLPPAFYGTVAALTLAWRGALPFHACVIERQGVGIMIAGASGAGKSSLTAQLLGLGARFVADDLAIVRARRADRGIEVFRGRPTMRQHRATAASVDAARREPIAGDARDKWLVRPTVRTPETALPLGGMLVLLDQHAPPGATARLELLTRNLFRPRWLAALPDYAMRRRDLLAIAAAVPITVFPPVVAAEAADQSARAARALAAIDAMIQR